MLVYIFKSSNESPIPTNRYALLDFSWSRVQTNLSFLLGEISQSSSSKIVSTSPNGKNPDFIKADKSIEKATK